MYASSREALRGVSSCTAMPLPAARSPISATSSALDGQPAVRLLAATVAPAALQHAVELGGARGAHQHAPVVAGGQSSWTARLGDQPAAADDDELVGGELHLAHQVAGERGRCGPRRPASRIRSRIQRTPSGSRPLTGSSNISTRGSPSSAAAMPSRCLMPSENPPTRLPGDAGQARPAPAPRRPGARRCRCCGPAQRRWSQALRPPCTASASSSAPTCAQSGAGSRRSGGR